MLIRTGAMPSYSSPQARNVFTRGRVPGVKRKRYCSRALYPLWTARGFLQRCHGARAVSEWAYFPGAVIE